MKKFMIAAICAASLVCLAGCETLFGYQEHEAPGTGSDKNSDMQRYACNTFSISSADDIPKDGRVVVFFNIDDFSFEGQMERAIVSALRSREVDAVSYAQKTFEANLDDGTRNPFLVAIELGGQHIMEINLGNISTYTIGGGIATMEFQSVLYQLYGATPVLKTAATATSLDNHFESFAQTVPLVCDVVAAAIAEEYLKICETPTTAENSEPAEQ